MLQDKIQKFQEETLREKTLKNSSKMLFNLQLIKSSQMKCLGAYLNRSSLQNNPMVDAKWSVG